MDSTLMRERFERDGFLVLPGFVAPAACEALRAAARQLVRRELPGLRPSIFSTASHEHAQDLYFAESGDKSRLFFEPGGLDEAGRPVAEPMCCLNKIGHAMHDLEPAFDAFSRTPRNAAVLASLGIARPHLVQSMYMCKQPRLGAAVDWHQDASFLVTSPASVIGLWFALEDATVDNGCLRAIPGGHLGPLRQRFVRSGEGLSLKTLDDTPFALDDAIPLEACAGTLVVLHGHLPHASEPNTSSRSREAYTLHVVDADAKWAADNWLVRRAEDPFRGFH